jgi:hypothetical protein
MTHILDFLIIVYLDKNTQRSGNWFYFRHVMEIKKYVTFCFGPISFQIISVPKQVFFIGQLSLNPLHYHRDIFDSLSITVPFHGSQLRLLIHFFFFTFYPS